MDGLPRIDGAEATSDSHVEQRPVVAGFLLDILCRYSERVIVGYALRLGMPFVVVSLPLCCLWHLLRVSEELLHEILTGEVAAPVVVGVAVRHTRNARRSYEERRSGILLGLVAVLPDREDYLLHSLLVDVVVAHEQLLISCETIDRVGREGIFAAVDDAVAVVLCLLVVVDFAVGVNLGVQCQLCMKGKGSPLVSTSEVLGIVE